MRPLRTFNYILAFILVGLGLAIAWLWHGYFVALERDRLARLDDEGFITLIGLPTSSAPRFITSTIGKKTETKPTTSSVNTTSTIKTVRTAISPLTGELILADTDLNLDVPYTSQAPERIWTQPWEDACEEASALMLDAYYRNYGLSTLSAKDELQKMVDWGQAKGWGGSIPIENIKILLQEYFKITRPIRLISNPTAADIKKLIAAGKPVLAVVDGHMLPNPYYSNGGPPYHALVVRGYTTDKFITNDPGVNRGKNFVFPIEAFMASLHDWNDGDVTNGTPMILVID